MPSATRPVAPLTIAQTPAEPRRHFQPTSCRADDGRLWGVTLCGPLIVVDGRTGLAVATAKPPAGSFAAERGVWIGRVPEGMQVANTAIEWEGALWSTVRLPLPGDAYLRDKLIAHEAFHRVQQALGLNARDAINAHLDEEDGRVLLRLELRALTAAATRTGATADAAARDAVLFRFARHRRYPGADTLEAMLELQEGLPWRPARGSRCARDPIPPRCSRLPPASSSRARPSSARSATGPVPCSGWCSIGSDRRGGSSCARKGSLRSSAPPSTGARRATSIAGGRCQGGAYDGGQATPSMQGH
ncbi:MAG: hypothetical protein H6691_06025 [Gemmatimonadales bacterium]|nr:hypothetical protein [Gemmatimonadales bacterium]